MTDEAVLTGLGEYLEALGFDCCVEASPNIVWQTATGHIPDTVFLHVTKYYNMPMNGLLGGPKKTVSMCVESGHIEIWSPMVRGISIPLADPDCWPRVAAAAHDILDKRHNYD